MEEARLTLHFSNFITLGERHRYDKHRVNLLSYR